MLACVCATFTTLMLVYLLPYVHRPGGLPYILGVLGAVLLLSLAAVALSVFPAFTPDVGRGINVVHVIDTDGQEGGGSDSRSFLSLASVTMGNLKEEAKHMGDVDLVCSRNSTLDFATYTVKYGCQKPVPLDENLWLRRPSLVVVKDEEGPPRVTTVRLDAGMSRRWFLAISSNKVARLQLEAVTDSTPQKSLISTTDISGLDGWHYIQYNGPSIASVYGYDGIKGPSTFLLTLHWSKNATDLDAPKLLKLRTDVPITTPDAEKMLEDVPKWCLSFGKSTSPYPLAYLATLPVEFNKKSATYDA
jgi:hypothetical protein